MLDNYQVVYKNLPSQINAFTIYCASENYYTVVLNMGLSAELQRKAFEHEIKHIMNNDFTAGKNVGRLEAIRH